MKIYNYHPTTGEYIGDSVADESPLEPGQYLIPAHATTEPPPETGENEAAVYTDGWQVVPDFRGADAWDPATRQIVEIVEVGKTLDDLGLVGEEPPPGQAVVRAAALAAIDASTRAAIIGGFVSSANGAPHRYDSDENDQKNLTLMQTVSHSPRFADHPVYQGRIPIRAVPEGQTEKTTLYLTAEQMDLLIEDLALHIGSCKQAGWAAQAEVE